MNATTEFVAKHQPVIISQVDTTVPALKAGEDEIVTLILTSVRKNCVKMPNRV
jgi:hypothetical protein